MKRQLPLFLSLLLAGSAIAQSTLERITPTTSELAREVLTNEDTAGFKARLGILSGVYTNGSGTNFSAIFPQQPSGWVFVGPSDGTTNDPWFRPLLSSDIPWATTTNLTATTSNALQAGITDATNTLQSWAAGQLAGKDNTTDPIAGSRISGTVPDASISANIARVSQLGTVTYTNPVFAGNGSGLTNVPPASITNAPWQQGSVSLTNLANITSTNGLRYINAVQGLSAKAKDRILSSFSYLEQSDIWSLFADGVVPGTDVNTNGATWCSMKGKAVWVTNSPTLYNYGASFGGSGAAILPLGTDCRTFTMVITFQGYYNTNGQVAGLSHLDTIDHTVGFWEDQALDYIAYIRQNFSGGQYRFVNPKASFIAGGSQLSVFNTEEHTITLTSDGTGVYQMAFDGDSSLSTTNVGFVESVALDYLVMGAAMDGSSVLNSWPGTLKSVLVFKAVLNSNQIREAMTFARWWDMREEDYVFTGDSMTTALQDARLNQNWPWQLMNGYGNTNRYFYRNMAINGHTVYSTADYNEYVAQFKPGGPVKKSTILSRWGGNDISLGFSASTIWTSLTNFWWLCNRDSYFVQALTITPATNYTYQVLTNSWLIFTNTQEVVRQDLNQRMATNAPYVSKVWRVDLLIPDMLTNRSPWSYDGLHQNAAGYARIANMIASGDNIPTAPSGATVTLPNVVVDSITTSSGAPIGVGTTFGLPIQYGINAVDGGSLNSAMWLPLSTWFSGAAGAYGFLLPSGTSNRAMTMQIPQHQITSTTFDVRTLWATTNANTITLWSKAYYVNPANGTAGFSGVYANGEGTINTASGTNLTWYTNTITIPSISSPTWLSVGAGQTGATDNALLVEVQLYFH